MKRFTFNPKLLKFSLKSILIGIGIVGCLLGLGVRRAHEQRSIVNWVVTNGGSVTYSHELDNFPFPADAPGPLWVREIVGIDFFDNVVVVSLGADVNDLEAVAGLPNLKSLYASNTRVADLKPLDKMSRLEALYLDNTKVSDLKAVGRLTNLRFLSITGTRVDDLSAISNLNQLIRLDIAETPISDLTPLARLPNLSRLDIRFCNVHSLEQLKVLTSLDYVNLYGTRFGAEQSIELQKELQNALPNCRAIVWEHWDEGGNLIFSDAIVRPSSQGGYVY